MKISLIQIHACCWYEYLLVLYLKYALDTDMIDRMLRKEESIQRLSQVIAFMERVLKKQLRLHFTITLRAVL